ncbi:MAG: helix-turn-helix transcriptional regulator, partial [Rhizobium sp.]
RSAVGYSIEDLAVTCGLANGEILEIENGESADPAKLRRIAAALQVPVSAFLHI